MDLNLRHPDLQSDTLPTALCSLSGTQTDLYRHGGGGGGGVCVCVWGGGGGGIMKCHALFSWKNKAD